MTQALQVDSLPLLDLRPRLDTSEFRSLLLSLVGWRGEPVQDQERLDRAIHRLRNESGTHVLGFEHAGHLVAMIVVALEAPARGVIRHVVIHHEWRNKGLGRALVRGAEHHLALSRLSAETDRNAVGFYQRIGFEVTSLGELYPGVVRFSCAHACSPGSKGTTG